VVAQFYEFEMLKGVWRRSVLLFSKKNTKNVTLIPKNDITEPKARLL